MSTNNNYFWIEKKKISNRSFIETVIVLNVYFEITIDS